MRIEAPSPAVAPPADRGEVKAAAEAFEALVLQEILRSARTQGLSDSPLVAGGEWRDLADRHLAEAMAKGAPLGLARLLGDALRKGQRA
ncbi:hypothetical protein [Thermaurantiacus sp.]